MCDGEPKTDYKCRPSTTSTPCLVSRGKNDTETPLASAPLTQLTLGCRLHQGHRYLVYTSSNNDILKTLTTTNTPQSNPPSQTPPEPRPAPSRNIKKTNQTKQTYSCHQPPKLTLVSCGSHSNRFSGHSSCLGTKCEKLMTLVEAPPPPSPPPLLLSPPSSPLIGVSAASLPFDRKASMQALFCRAKNSAITGGASRSTVTKSCRRTGKKTKKGSVLHRHR